MNASQPVRLGAVLLLALNILMAFGSIWVFVRMTPAIEVILDRNDVSLEACEDMLAALAKAGGFPDERETQRAVFDQALSRAKNMITEEGESENLDAITQSFPLAFEGDPGALTDTLLHVRTLSRINRQAMERADGRASQLGKAGAWGVVFMASLIYLVGILFLRSLDRNLLDPMKEMDQTMESFLGGETRRRCSMKNPSREIRNLFRNLNQILDRCLRRD